jgi:hypothetical protein
MKWNQSKKHANDRRPRRESLRTRGLADPMAIDVRLCTKEATLLYSMSVEAGEKQAETSMPFCERDTLQWHVTSLGILYT